MDVLSLVTSKLDTKTMKSILDRVTMGMTERADVHNLAVAEADEEIHKQVWETVSLTSVAQVHVDLNVTDWVILQWEYPMLKTVIKWISNWEVQDL